MAEVVTMPKWGLTMAEGRIVEWMVEEDEPVREGEVLCLVETDKITVEVPSPSAGVVARILVPDGQTATVGTPIAILARSVQEAQQIRGGPR